MRESGEGKLNVDAVVFDLDGTLIDSLDVYCKILNTALERVGLPTASKKNILRAIREGGFIWDFVLPEKMKSQKDVLIRKVRGVIDEIYPRMFRKEVKIIEGAAGILKRIAARGIKIGLVTSTPRTLLEDKLYPLQQASVEDVFEGIITTDDIHNKKPAADPLIECGKRLGVNRNKIVYVGDTRIDMQAGRAAGMKTVGVLTGYDTYQVLMSEDPEAVIPSVGDLGDVISLDLK
jgi:HAD superfamily hydrolase (TIGR01509 family)